MVLGKNEKYVNIFLDIGINRGCIKYILRE